jgi:L-xylulokinase
MKPNILIGVDMGSSSLKALALEAASGRTVALSRMPLPHDRLAGGGCEVGAPAIRAALTHVLRDVAQQLGPRMAEIRAMACTGHGAGLYALDADGQLVGGRAVASTDQRADARARALAASRGAQLFEDVGCSPWPGQPTVIAAELLGADAVQRGELRRLLFAKDYLGFLLTGEIATDASDASTAGLVSLATGNWSQAAFDASGIAELGAHAFGPIVPSGTVIGKLRPSEAALCGLPAGIPVAMGAIDLLASMTAIGAEARGRAVSVFGTWCVNAVVGPVLEPKPAVAAIVNFGRRNERLYMENSPSSMANIAWLARTLQFPSAAAVVECAMTVPLGAEGLRFVPFINGGSAPPGATAGFIGLAGHHERAHMARAVVDAVVALHAQHLSRLASFGLGAPGRVAALGGGARDARLVQLLASMLGHAVERCGDDETGARGAALHAAQAVGAPPEALPAPSDLVEPSLRDLPACVDFRTGFAALLDNLAPAFAQLAAGGRP